MLLENMACCTILWCRTMVTIVKYWLFCFINLVNVVFGKWSVGCFIDSQKKKVQPQQFVLKILSNKKTKPNKQNMPAKFQATRIDSVKNIRDWQLPDWRMILAQVLADLISLFSQFIATGVGAVNAIVLCCFVDTLRSLDNSKQFIMMLLLPLMLMILIPNVFSFLFKIFRLLLLLLMLLLFWSKYFQETRIKFFFFRFLFQRIFINNVCMWINVCGGTRE